MPKIRFCNDTWIVMAAFIPFWMQNIFVLPNFSILVKNNTILFDYLVGTRCIFSHENHVLNWFEFVVKIETHCFFKTKTEMVWKTLIWLLFEYIEIPKSKVRHRWLDFIESRESRRNWELNFKMTHLGLVAIRLCRSHLYEQVLQ